MLFAAFTILQVKYCWVDCYDVGFLLNHFLFYFGILCLFMLLILFPVFVSFPCDCMLCPDESHLWRSSSLFPISHHLPGYMCVSAVVFILLASFT